MSASTSSEFDNLLPLEGAKSAVWAYFGFPAMSGELIEKEKKKRKEVFCKLCHKQMNYLGNTTNMCMHLKYHHPQEHGELLKAFDALPKAPAKEKDQRTITESLLQCEPLSHSSQCWKKLTDAVCYFIAKDTQPFDTVTDHGFRHMLRVFEPRYIPPDRKTVTTHYMPQMYECVRANIVGKMDSDTEQFALTTDGGKGVNRNSLFCPEWLGSTYAYQQPLCRLKGLSV